MWSATANANATLSLPKRCIIRRCRLWAWRIPGHVLAGRGGEVEVVDLIDQDKVTACLDEDLADRVGDVGGVPVLLYIMYIIGT